jgi:transcriptional regulator with XRE-family HTH domain
MPSTGSNPTVRRWELAARLRQLRVEAGRSIEDAAGELMCSVAKISRLETGGRGVQPRDVRDLCRFYGVSDDVRDELIQIAQEARKPGWWQDFRTLDEQVATLIGLEDAADEVCMVDSLRMPGLFQTEEYSRALIPQLRPAGELTDRWIDETVLSRRRRQERISSGALRFRAVMDEAVLRRPVGDPGVMRRQIERLAAEARRDNVTLQVIPFARGPHPGLEGSFQLLQFPAGRLADLVFVEGLVGQFLIEKPAEVQHYHDIYSDLASRFALPPAETVAWLKEFMDAHL